MSNKNKKNKKMNPTITIALASGICLSGLCTYLAVQTFGTVPMLVAATDITEPYSRAITAEDFVQIEVSRRDKKSFQEFEQDINSLVGKIPTTTIIKGQPVKRTQFVDPNVAEEVNTIVSDKNLRGIYLPITNSGALNGDLKSGSTVDFYLMVKTPKATSSDPEAKEWTVVPFQESYTVKKLAVNEDEEMSVFFEFPKEESERYVLLKESLSGEDMKLIAVMPNPIHDKYDGKSLTYSEFESLLRSNPDYFKKMSDIVKNNSQNDVNITVNDSSQNTQSNVEPVEDTVNN